ncbi:MAG: arylsulfatase [Caulobacterales bacterium]|nr:arylsulfatase [Caulobacterales bacterium]
MRRMMMCAGLALTVAGCAATPPDGGARTERPNFLIVVADDLGWSDIGPFGGEIRTPTLDALAARGTLMTSFYVAPTCSPTRAMLMTGVDSHTAGVGAMSGIQAPNQTTRNYAAQLHEDVVTIAEVLKDQGYHTMLSGKWHLAVDEEQRPHNRGFERSFALLPGGASHFADARSLNPEEVPVYVEDGEEVALPNDFYSSITYTDKILQYFGERETNAPFFAYLAYTAPHDPLQVPEDWLDRYAGVYDDGPLAIRAARTHALEAKGLIAEGLDQWPLPPFPPQLPLHQPPWEDRAPDERAADARAMEIYAAMIELMDQQLGRVLAALEDSGELENTYVIFFSDNGASAVVPLVYPGNTVEWLAENWPGGPETAGREGSFTVLDREWAYASATPWRFFKGWVGEGGVRSPFIVAGPSAPAGARTDALAHVSDIAPTIYELVGVDAAADPLFAGKIPPDGASLASVWATGAEEAERAFGIELFDNKAYRRGPWKITFHSPPRGSGQWELFDMSSDPGETRDLAAEHPEILASLIADYEAYAERNGVIPPVPPPSIRLRQMLNGPCDADCERAFHDFEERRRARRAGGGE